MILAVRKIIIDDSNITNLVDAENVFVNKREQITPLPAILLEVDGNNPNETKSAASGLDEWDMVITVFAENYSDAWVISEEVRLSIDQYTGNVTVAAPVSASIGIARIVYQGQSEDHFEQQEGIHFISERYKVSQLRDGAQMEYPLGDPVRILDQDDNLLAEVDPGGSYHVFVLDEVNDEEPYDTYEVDDNS